MAASSISMLALLLLMSAVTPGLSTEGEGSQDHTVTALIIAMREVSRALEGFGDTVQEGLRQQRQSSDALTDLHTLTATVLRVEERINKQDGKIESLKEKIEDITKVGDLQRLLDNKTSENERNVHKLDDLQVKFEAKSRESKQNLRQVELFTQLLKYLENLPHNKNHTSALEDALLSLRLHGKKSSDQMKVGDLQRLLDNKTSENERNVDKVQDLGRNLDESRQYAEMLEQLVQQLNITQENKKDVPGCAERKIKNLVLQYIGSRNWQALRRGLDAEMDHRSGAYGELKNMDQYSVYKQYDMGYCGYTQLVTLLLCAGMPVDLTGEYNYTLLIGAASGGQYQLVKMLLWRGADVNARDSSGRTPLMVAAINGHLETVKLLVQAGADTTATDVNGHNALYHAKIHGNTAVQQYLEQFSA